MRLFVSCVIVSMRCEEKNPNSENNWLFNLPAKNVYHSISCTSQL